MSNTQQSTEGNLAVAFRRAGVVPLKEHLDQIARDAWNQHPGENHSGKRRNFVGAYLKRDITWTLIEQWRPSDLGAAIGWLLELHKPTPTTGSLPKLPAIYGRQPARMAEREEQAAKARTKADIVAKVVVKLSMLDTFKVNGQPVGDCTPEEAEGWATSRERDARFIRMLIQPCPPGRPIRESWLGEDADRLFEKERA